MSVINLIGIEYRQSRIHDLADKIEQNTFNATSSLIKKKMNAEKPRTMQKQCISHIQNREKRIIM